MTMTPFGHPQTDLPAKVQHTPGVPASRLRRNLCAAALCTPVSGVGRAAQSLETVIAPTVLREDLSFWRRAIFERHPRYHGAVSLESELEAAFAQVAAGLTQPLVRAQAWRQFARLNPLLKDAHSLLMPWPDGASPDDSQRRRQFPFGLALDVEGRLRLRSHWRRAGDGVELPARAAVLSINGLDTDELLRRLEPYSHGETAALRRHMLSLMLPQWMHAVLGWRDRFELSLAGSVGGASRAVWVAAEDRWTSARQPAWMPTWRVLTDEVALLRVPTFDVDENPAAFAAAVDTAFRAIRARSVSRLIVDVRGNTGGQSDAGAQVLSRFLDRPARQASRARERLNVDNNGWLGWRGKPGTLREFDLGREALVEPAPAAERFQGKVAVLIDEMTYSAGILFATAMQDLKLATLIGRPTGGRANQTGNMVLLRLPGTGLSGYIASREFVRPSGDLRVAPVQPDIVFDTAAADTAADTAADRVLERAVSWLAQGR